MTSIDPHFYTYDNDGFHPAPSVIDWELGELGAESDKVFLANGWIKADDLGEEDDERQFMIYRPIVKDGESISADGRRLVELWDSCSCIWTALVDPAYWPKFHRDEIRPMLNQSRLHVISEQLKRLSNAVIGSARYASAISSDIDRWTGEATKDLKKDQEITKRYMQSAN